MRHGFAILLAALLAGGPALAEEHDHDHDRARRAVEEGRILPLRDILARAESSVPGQMVGVELEEEHGAMVYEIKMVTTDGRVMTLLYDARTGELIKAGGR
jgi:uncharacterized membrane protein YkoI